MKVNEVVNESQQLNEWAFLLPAIATAVRIGAPALGRFLFGQAVKQTAKQAVKQAPKVIAGLAGKAVVGTGKVLLKHPGAAITATSGYYVYKSVDEAITAISSMVGDALDPITIKAFALVAIKYALPVAAIVAILYGGKKLHDYMNNTEEPVATANG
jgi:hypothetical protein